MKQPKISIITITYNSEKTLKRTIESVLSQQYSNLEYIIVDGGSKDDTIDIVKSYGPKISKFISEPDEGISDAFNKGILMATGDIVGIINSDDGLCENALSHLSEMYDESIDVYRGDTLLWNEDTETKVVEIPSMTFSFRGRNNIGHQSTFIRKDAYLKYGMYDKSCKYAMDFDLLKRYENAGAKFLYVDKTLAFYTQGGLTATKITADRVKEHEYIIRKNGGASFDVFCYRVNRMVRNIGRCILSKDMRLKMRRKK